MIMQKRSLVHIILLALIALIIIIGVVRLIIWNNGTDPEADIEQVDPSQFDIEVLDMIIPMESSRLEGHEDDGELTILCLGNNPFSDDRSDEGLAKQIAKKTGATVYDASFPGSSTAYKNLPFDPNYPLDNYSLPGVTACLLNNSFETMEAGVQYMNDPDVFREGLDTLESVDMNKVDVVILMYDATDYRRGTPCDNEDVPTDLLAFTGGLRYFMQTAYEKWPHVRIFVMTPTYVEYVDENGQKYSSTVKDIGNGALPYYVQKEIDATIDSGCSVIDNYYGTINEENYKDYMEDDYRYNDAGRELLAERISFVINNKMSTVSVQ